MTEESSPCSSLRGLEKNLTYLRAYSSRQVFVAFRDYREGDVDSRIIQKAREKGIPVEIFYHASTKEAEQPSTLNEQPSEALSNQESI